MLDLTAKFNHTIFRPNRSDEMLYIAAYDVLTSLQQAMVSMVLQVDYQRVDLHGVKASLDFRITAWALR